MLKNSKWIYFLDSEKIETDPFEDNAPPTSYFPAETTSYQTTDTERPYHITGKTLWVYYLHIHTLLFSIIVQLIIKTSFLAY